MVRVFQCPNVATPTRIVPTEQTKRKAFVQEIGYDRFVAPPSLGNGTKPKLHLTLDVERITEINEKNGFFRCQLWLGRKWIDTRLSFQNLKKESDLNDIDPEDVRSRRSETSLEGDCQL